VGSATPVFTADAYIQVPSWTLSQAPLAPSYAYEQLNFAADFQMLGGTLLGSTPNLPLTVTGTVGSTVNYAQFDAVIDYTWVPYTGVNGFGTWNLGTPVPLGQLTYSYLQNNVPGSFAYSGTSSGALGATTTTQGILEITGEMWVAGDPSSIDVSMTAPEPSSLGLLALGLAALARRSRVQHKARN
jgi:hypothetical protein